MRSTHPVRPGLNLLDGGWYADDPHEVWRWMRRDAPVYYDETADVWGIAKTTMSLPLRRTRSPSRASGRLGPTACTSR